MIPSKSELASKLRHVWAYMRVHEPGLEDLDVRLQVTPTTWRLHTGDACYDTDHSGHWGVGTVFAEDSSADLERLAEDLIEQVIDSASNMC